MKIVKSLFVILFPLFVFAVEVVDFKLVTDDQGAQNGDTVIVEAQLSLDSRSDIPQPTLQSGDGYAIIGKRKFSRIQLSEVVKNGRVVGHRQVFTVFFQYQIEVDRIGETTIPSVDVLINGRTYSTAPLILSVSQFTPDMTVEFQRARSQIYLTEQFPLKIRFKTRTGEHFRLDNEGFNQIIEPVLGALSEKFSITITTESVVPQDIVENKTGYTVVDYDLSLMAIDTGTVAISPITYAYTEGLLENFMGMMVPSGRQSRRTTQSPRLILSVLKTPLAPSGYKGVVGRVMIKSFVNGDSLANGDTVKVGEGVTLKYTLSGRMGAAALGTLSLPELSDFEQFSPERRSVADSSNGVIFTKKDVSYMLIPRSVGEYTIPRVSVIWFDPITGEYNTEWSKEFTVTVLPSDTPVETTTRYLTQETIQMYGDDIRYIKTDLPNSVEALKPYKKAIFLILLPLPWIILIISILFKLSAKLAPKDRERVVRKGSLGRAYKELNAIEKGKSKASPAGVIEKYLLEKYKISAPSMRRDQLRTELVSSGATDDAANSILAFLDSVELSRYSGGASKLSLVSDAKKVLKQITKEVN